MCLFFVIVVPLGRGGNDTTRLPRHPDPEVERKREEERIKNKLYQSTSRSIKDAEFKSAQAQIAVSNRLPQPSIGSDGLAVFP